MNFVIHNLHLNNNINNSEPGINSEIREFSPELSVAILSKERCKMVLTEYIPIYFSHLRKRIAQLTHMNVSCYSIKDYQLQRGSSLGTVFKK